MAEQRKSSRLNKGQPPTRLGFEVSGSQNLPIPNQGSRIGSTIRSTTSTSRIKFVVAEKKQQLAMLKKSLLLKRSEVKVAQQKHNSLQQRLSQIKEKIEHGAASQELLSEEECVLEQLRNAECDLFKLQSELEVMENIHADDVEVIEARADAQLEAITSEQELTSGDKQESVKDKDCRVQEWVNRTSANEVRSILSYSIGNRPEFSESLYNNRAEETPHRPAIVSREDDGKLVSQLVTALGQAFGTSHHAEPVRSGIDRELPFFDGNPADWENFKCEFIRTTKKYNFENSENLCRMRKSLKGDAAMAVKHLMANPSNLSRIWEVLETRFGRPEFVLDYLIEQAKSMKSPELSKPESLVDFGTAIDALVTNICAYNETDYMHNRQLTNEFVGKLPASMKTQWYEYLSSDFQRKPNLHQFSQWLQFKVNAAVLAIKPKVKQSEGNEEKGRKGRRSSGVIHIASGEEKQGDISNKCIVCNELLHGIWKCPAFSKMTVQQRWDKVKELKLCISCLKVGHRSRKCRYGKKCLSDNCGRYHHRLLHGLDISEKPELAQVVSTTVTNPQANDEEPDVVGEINLALVVGCDGPLPILPVFVKGPRGTRKTYSLMDSGASRSLISKDLADAVGLDGDRINYCYRAVNGAIVYERNAAVVSCDVSSTGRSPSFFPLRSAVTVEKLQFKPYSINVNEIKNMWPHLHCVQAKNLKNVRPEIIVGNDNASLLLARKIVSGPEGAPIGWWCRLGWTISGSLYQSTQTGSVNLVMGSDEHLHELIKQSFSTENFGVHPSNKKGMNMDEQRAYKILANTTKQVGQRWETGLLWKQDHVQLPESELAAYRRLVSLEKKFNSYEYKQLYCEKILELKEKGFIRKLTKEEANIRTGKTWYLPQFGVVNPNKPGKIRLVLDAAAKVNGTSLNDCLLKGPDLMRPLLSIIWNFRLHRFVITGDITDMFPRVFIREEDRQSQRFLWRDGDITREPDHYEMISMIFGAASSPCSAIYVKNKNAELYQKSNPTAVEAIIEDFYMDDCLTGADTLGEIIKLRKDITTICESGGFSVCKWNSNSREVLASIPVALRGENTKFLQEKSELPVERVLGLWWNPNEDNFVFKLNLHKVNPELLKGNIPTKRELCSMVMSIFDPLGLVNFCKIKGLMLLQATWVSGTEWDELLPESQVLRFQTWINELHQLKGLAVPRLYSTLLYQNSAVELHTFVDASEEAFSAVSYLVVKKDGQVDVAFISSKVRVAPVKKLTIPRLELQAAVLGSRLAYTIRQEIKVKISRCVFWSDSKTVLQWVRSPSINYKEFVANRIGEIQELTDPVSWRWVPSKENVADDATRFYGDLITIPERWFIGPNFLREHEENWPKCSQHGVIMFTQIDLVEDSFGSISFTNEERMLESNKVVDYLIPEVNRFSSHIRLLRASAAVKKVAEIWMVLVRRQSNNIQWTFTPTDLEDAEVRILRHVQETCFPSEISEIRSGKKVTKGRLFKLSPVLRNGLLCVKSRLVDADGLSDNIKYPIILPSKHHYTELVIHREHVRCGHQGKETVLANLRERYWIIDGRCAVSRGFHNCLECKFRRVKPIIPEMGNIPNFRLAAYQPAFSFTGLDFWGPTEVTVGRRHEKRWGVIFCCMTTRAVHLEIAHGLSTDHAIMAISRFIDTRGRPLCIYSDNGLNFVGARRELQQQAKNVNFEEIAVNEKYMEIKWCFNPAAAPHFGGAWERFIQTVKKCLSSILKEKYPQDSTLLTAVKSVEGILNSRPLTHVSTDPNDSGVLTPNHFLRGHCNVGPPIPTTVQISDEVLRSQWRRSNLFAEQFWRKWTKEFLPKLMTRGKWWHEREPLKVGDLVLVVDDNLPRNMWKRGWVSKVFPGKDRQVRVVEVTTTTSTYKRPVSKICPIGLRKFQDS